MCLPYLFDFDSRLLTASSLRHYGLLCGRHFFWLLRAAYCSACDRRLLTLTL